jgi:hypothetical protein
LGQLPTQKDYGHISSSCKAVDLKNASTVDLQPYKIGKRRQRMNTSHKLLARQTTTNHFVLNLRSPFS